MSVLPFRYRTRQREEEKIYGWLATPPRRVFCLSLYVLGPLVTYSRVSQLCHLCYYCRYPALDFDFIDLHLLLTSA